MRMITSAVLLGMFLLLLSAGCTEENQDHDTPTPGPAGTSPIQSPVKQLVTTTAFQQTTASATTPPPEDIRFSNPLHLNQQYLFGNGTKWVSDASVTRFWINDTYHWYNPEELQYDTRIAPEGKKYLIIFVSFVDYGSQRAPLPPQGNIYIRYDATILSPYAKHPLPMKNPDSTPRIARIAEIEYSHKTFSSELVEDYGYSHGQKLAYIAPGESNAVEGYIIYEVPAELTPEKTYVLMVLPDRSEAVWVLA